jgi:ABC-2 type transport system permease protein
MSSQRIIGIVIRHLYIWPRSLERLMWNFGWPFLDLIIWGLASSYLQKNLALSFSIVTFFLGGVIFWNILWRAQNEVAVNFLDEAWNHNLINIFSTPLKSSEFLLGMVIINLLKLVFTVGSLTLGGFIIYKFNFFSSFGFFIPFLLLNLLLIGWSVGFFVIGLILRFGWSVSEMAWAIAFLIQPFSCVFYPITALPSWGQKIALTFPSSYVFEEMRRILFKGEVVWNNLLISFFLNILYLVLSLLFFRFMFEKAREHGRLVKLN